MNPKAKDDGKEAAGPCSLFATVVEQPAAGAPSNEAPSRPRPYRPSRRFQDREQILGIQDLLWKEGIQALHVVESCEDEAAFLDHLRRSLPQNSDVTRVRYVNSLMRWFFPDGVRGLAAKVWLNYRDPVLAEEILRFLYLRAEPMVGTVVSEALFAITDNAKVPEDYIARYLRGRWDGLPEKSIKRVRTNLRKLGILVREKAKDVFRAPTCTATGFLVVLHYVFASGETRGVEFRAIRDDPFWKYLGFQSEDRLRDILKEALAKGLIAKYVVADQIESVSFRYSFDEFVSGKYRL